MANMSYCRFQNTVSDLHDCAKNMMCSYDLSYDEFRARRHLIKLCAEIADNYHDELDEKIPSREEFER